MMPLPAHRIAAASTTAVKSGEKCHSAV